jgi:hypothetical protein
MDADHTFWGSLMQQAGEIYVFGGITLFSQIALPELPIGHEHSPLQNPVSIRLGEVGAPWPGAVELDPDCFATPQRYLLRIPGLASYSVTNGKEIVVDPAPGAEMLDVRAYLLGTVFTVLCQQRGFLPLHASAVSGKGGVAAFLGRSGQGKSSLAAHLAVRGFDVVADDVCLIDPTSTGEVMVTPAAPWLKLWRTSLNNLGRNEDGLERVFSEEDKYRLPLAGAGNPQPIRLLFFLAPENPSVLVTTIEEISRPEAVSLLMNLTHQAYLLEATAQREESFRRSGRVLSQARAYRLHRPWGLEHLESTVDAVQQFLLSHVAGESWPAR